MADSINPNANNIIGAGFLPKIYQTESNKKFLQSTIDQLLQPGTVKKVNGYIGRQNAKASTSDDIFISAADVTRQNYQLEPGFVVKDTSNNITFLKDYQDYINQLQVFGANVSNHERLNTQEFYSWNPHIDWDKFVNFQNYYWLPDGPDIIVIRGHELNTVTEMSVSLVANSGSNVYVFTPDGITSNPVLTLYRGQTYVINVDSPNNPFSVKTERVTGPYSRYYSDTFDNVGIESGQLIFPVPLDAPDILYYQSETDVDIGGVIHILDITENTEMDVAKSIIGKKSYVLSDGTAFSNGMKVTFEGNITPVEYASGSFYVEGVGSSIKLISSDILEVVGSYTTAENILFDSIPFDSKPFADATSYAGTPDYIVINRSSDDHNYWTRYNRWVHKDVIAKSASRNGKVSVEDQSARAIRPIIEFDANLKLYNFGTSAIQDINMIDTSTTDVFSTIEGAYGYNVDGIQLANGHRILFTADTDKLVHNKIYQVEFVDVLHETATRTINTYATSTISDGDLVVVETSENMILWQRIVFSGEGIGNIIPEKEYFVSSIVDLNTITISEKINTPAVVQRNDTGNMTVNAVYRKTSRQIHLNEVATPVINQVTLIKDGIKNKGKMVWYNGSEWVFTQEKTHVNQPPMFDIVDELGISYGDTTSYVASSFEGTKLFSYKVGSGANDTVLGFPLAYKNINNIGDIVFNFDLVTDSFQYNSPTVKTKYTDIGFLVKTENNSTNYVNGWIKNTVDMVQGVVRIYKNAEVSTTVDSIITDRLYTIYDYVDTDFSDAGIWYSDNRAMFIGTAGKLTGSGIVIHNDYVLDMFDDITMLSDLRIKVFVNGIWIADSNWTTYDLHMYKVVRINYALSPTDVVTIRAYTQQPTNSKGFYEIPNNLQNNPLNEVLVDFTLGEVIDHVGSIVQNIQNFTGIYPGVSNLRDAGNVSSLGTKFVQHSGPFGLSLYHITTEVNNIIRAIEKSRDDYVKFKKLFMTVAETLGVETDPAKMVDLILQKINKDKQKSSPYYFSDMVPYGAKVKRDFTVIDVRNTLFPLLTDFNLSSLSNKAVGVYRNGVQLLREHEYEFSTGGFVNIFTPLVLDDVITIYEYDSTDGCYIPETPAKLGILPDYDPKIYLDTTYVTPRTMIQGHDGSLVLAYGDYRDEVLLELEKRIYNNIKVGYDLSIFDINDVIPSYNRSTLYSLSEFNTILAPNFYKWSRLVNRDFSKHLNYDRNNPFTFNYKNHQAPDGQVTPGYWRGIYRWILDTDRPNICPWEILGFFDEPAWWTSVYGPAPYTSDNLVMWYDIAEGKVKEPGKPVRVLTKYKKEFLKSHIPVDENGNLISPLHSQLSNGIITENITGDFVFGDISPVESAWRKSSHYSFSLLSTMILMYPAKCFGVFLDRSRIDRNLTNQLVYTNTGLRITPTSIILPNTYSSTDRIQTAGIINYIINYIVGDNLKSYTSYIYDLKNISCRLTHRIGAFTSKPKYNLLLDAKTPNAIGSIFVPPENYEVVLSNSNAIRKITYSGVIITKMQDGFEVKGYSTTTPYFKILNYIGSGVTINVGGISENYVDWTANQTYAFGSIVKFENNYYRVKSPSALTVGYNLNSKFYEATTVFDTNYCELLVKVPIVGGVDANFRTKWDKQSEIVIPYGTKFATVQDVVDFLLGYGEYLKSIGFVFDQYSADTQAVFNWETSAKQFIFWTTQNWATGQEKWKDWDPDNATPAGTIVRVNGDYYRAKTTVKASQIFDETKFELLDGLSSVGSAVISLSPAAERIVFNTSTAIVDDINNPFNEYEIVRVDGRPISDNFLNSYREDNTVSYSIVNADGIYGATFYLIQKEHMVVLDNTTMFNDVIYSPASGYKQDRVKVSGYISTAWNGSMNVPGFIIDRAEIKDWEMWKDYALGETVKYKQFYYSATMFIPGMEVFEPTKWVKLDKKPSAGMLPNWTYKATQFEDFYNLDSDNFDSQQQKMAQHLVGYQKRQYLENIIQDDVSEFKFYQGMIVEKGTQNVLNKLFDVLSASDKESLSFYEEWAIRVGQYGASAGYDNIEFILDETKFKTNPQGFELVSSIPSDTTDFIIRQLPKDVYLAPAGYTSTPWKTVTNSKRYLRSAGYARADEMRVVVKDLSELKTLSIDFDEGDYVWCTFEESGWNVYRYTNTYYEVKSITQVAGITTIHVDKHVSFAVNSYISIRVGNTLLFYMVLAVSANSFQVEMDGLLETPSDLTSVLIFKFKSHRVRNTYNTDGTIKEYAKNLIDTVVGYDINSKELVWVDDNGFGKWETLQHSPVYQTIPTVNPEPSPGMRYGKAVVMSADDKMMAVSVQDGGVFVYDRLATSIPWIHRQTIDTPTVAITTGKFDSYSSVLAMSADGRWLAVGSPNISYVSSNFVGVYNSSTKYAAGSIIKYNNSLRIVPITPSYDITKWPEINYPAVEIGEVVTGFVNQGVISLYERDSGNIFNLVDSIVSPTASADEQFGSSIKFGNESMYIGAPGSKAVYKMIYTTVTKATAVYNPNGSSGTTIKLSSVTGISAGMILVGNGFVNNQIVMDVDSTNSTILISAAPDSQPSGTIRFTAKEWKYSLDATLSSTVTAFGKYLSVSKDYSTVVVSANNTVCIYRNGSTTPYTTMTGIVPEYGYGGNTPVNQSYGDGTTVSNDGTYVAISDTMADLETLNQGTVYVYKNNGTTYQQVDTLHNVKPESSQHFGKTVEFVNDYNTLIVYSDNSDTIVKTTFDKETTTFDNKSTTVSVISINSGRIDVYDNYLSSWVYGESLNFNNNYFTHYGSGISVGSNTIIVSATAELEGEFYAGRVYEYRKLEPTDKSWTVIHNEIDKPDVHKIKQAFLYNKTSNSLITYLDVVDPLQGKIPGIADQDITYKLQYDPAVYSVLATADTLVIGRTYLIVSIGTTDFTDVGASVNQIGQTFVATATGSGTGTASDVDTRVDEGLAWAENQVGSLWWDLRTSKFIDSYDNEVVYRNSTWSTLAYGASVDVYEWVESTIIPSEWDAQADTEGGLAAGISGTSLYSDSAYCVVRKYDTIGKIYKNTYYFWVKNKKTIPNIRNRSLSGFDVANLIANPRGEGYQYLSLTGSNSFSLTNVQQHLKTSDVVLSVEYWTIENKTQNIHTQWKLISNSLDTIIPATIEEKWIDSLCGKDNKGRLVPEPTLPIKLKYGIENRPRQSMFVNRVEALKQFVEQVNLVLAKRIIIDSRTLSGLSVFDAEPHVVRGVYDTIVDTDAELRFTGFGTFLSPSLTPKISNGKIVGINIVASGQGYVNAPFIEVHGNGKNAVVKSVINSRGQIIGAVVENAGVGYDANTMLTIRDYSVLVHSDSQASGNWSIYSYSPVAKAWSRVYTQTYNTLKFWNYIDWYADGINKFTVVEHSVETYAELQSTEIAIGSLVKVRTTDSGAWTILKKKDDVNTADWTYNYDVVALQNGTIALSSALYDFSDSTIGYDGSSYDGGIFDNSASVEIRTIINSIKTDILIGDLKSEYLNLFFTGVRYALSEQTYLDWIFKTSFVKVSHNVGGLHQPVNYRNDNLANYEDYVAEIKPYRTQIREYISTYASLDNTNTMVSDFDLPTVFSDGIGTQIYTSIENGNIIVDNNAIRSYPWKNWADNVGFSVVSLIIIDSGDGYLTPPIVNIVSDSGSGATASAFVANGKITRVVLKTGGAGYLSAPIVEIVGGTGNNNAARVIAIIGDSVIRSNLMKMKFDRISKTTYLSQLEETETFTGSGSKLQFKLTWSPDKRVNTSSVTVDGIPVLRDTYSLTTTKSTTRGYTSYYGIITFTTPPAKDSEIIVNYLKDWNVLSAADRIKYYYSPADGEVGNDLSQIITGVDYGGAIITGLDFSVGGGWDSTPYFSSKWDDYDLTLDDYTVQVAANATTLTLPYRPVNGTEINVYYTPNLTVSYQSNGVDTVYIIESEYPSVTASISSTHLSAETAKGSHILNLHSTTGISVDDVVTCDSNPLLFSYETKVTAITSTTVTLNQIVFGDVSNNTSITFRHPISENQDYTIARDAILGMVLTMKYVINASNMLEVKGIYQPKRIDDVNFGTPDQTNVNAIMATPIIGTSSAPAVVVGTSSVAIMLPSYFSETVNEGDIFTLRRSTSDGAIAPQVDDYDTALTGGNMAYSTATGIAADDIVVDGDAFVSETTSPAPEEVVPGQVVDAVAIKVFDSPRNGAAHVKVDTIVADGVSTIFNMSQLPNSMEAIIVKVDDEIVSSTGYDVNFKDQTIELQVTPAAKSIVSIFNIGISGNNILDYDSIVADGETTEFITNAEYSSTISSLVYVNGIVSECTIFATSTDYPLSNMVGLRFSVAPALNDLITFIIVNSAASTFAVTSNERIANPSQVMQIDSYIGNSYPLESSMIVIGKTISDGSVILAGPNNIYFTVKKNKLKYLIDDSKFLPHTVGIDKIYLYVDNTILRIGSEYTFDVTTNEITLVRSIAAKYANHTLIVSVVNENGYFITPQTKNAKAQLTITNNTDYEYIEVVSSYIHDSLNIETTTEVINNSIVLTPDSVEYFTYKNITGGSIKLRNQPVDDNYVWVVMNGKLLTKSVDFKLDDDRQTVLINSLVSDADTFMIMVYGNNILKYTTSYMQFKDMLNRTHYKRLSANKQTKLVHDLHVNDITITVEDASNFDLPNPAANKPGIIEIRGERIEFFGITGNVLSKIRRGTLGTGTPTIHVAGTYVQEIGASENIPYVDNINIQQVMSNGTNELEISLTPSVSSVERTYVDGFTSTIPDGYGMTDDIEVFVGGYNDNSVWESGQSYIIGDIVIVNSYTYRCIVAHTSTTRFKDDYTNWQFFIGNIRLKKSPYKVHDVNIHPESSEGDVQMDAEFSANGTNTIWLTNKLDYGTYVTIVHRTGKVWGVSTPTLSYDGSQYTFIDAVPGVHYTSMR